jgi:EAL domain-containing protein (putative c-di-GMP-specific phosphodiesterase class I)
LLTLELDERHPPPAAAETSQPSTPLVTIPACNTLPATSQVSNITNLGLAYLKIDGSYIRAIDQEADKRTFIEALYRAANSIDMPLIAEMVETQGELDTLKELGIEGAMGRLIGAPAPCQD